MHGGILLPHQGVSSDVQLFLQLSDFSKNCYIFVQISGTDGAFYCTCCLFVRLLCLYLQQMCNILHHEIRNNHQRTKSCPEPDPTGSGGLYRSKLKADQKYRGRPGEPDAFFHGEDCRHPGHGNRLENQGG